MKRNRRLGRAYTRQEYCRATRLIEPRHWYLDTPEGFVEVPNDGSPPDAVICRPFAWFDDHFPLPPADQADIRECHVCGRMVVVAKDSPAGVPRVCFPCAGIRPLL